MASQFSPVEPGQSTIGWIGTGVMGRSMAANLQQAGFALQVYNRSRDKAASLLEQGARWTASPREAAAGCAAVFTIVGRPNDVREVYLGDEGLLAGCAPGTIAVDMTTSEPQLAVELYAVAQTRGVATIDAPVSGGDVGAREGTLSIMIGGDEAAIAALDACWQAMGKTIVRQGPAGAGQHAKMVNQTLIASGIIGLCEALLYGHRAGLDMETVLRSVSGGAAGSWSLTNYGPRILANQFDPGFSVEHFLKDLRIVLHEAERMRLSLPGLALARQLYLALEAQGGGQLGIHGLQLVLARLNGLEWTSRDQKKGTGLE